MKILILNGSPKGDYSTTLYTSLYLQKVNAQHQFQVLNVGKQIRQFERDFAPAAAALQDADLIVFSYPVYTFIAPSQLHRFIELMKAAIAAGSLVVSGKFATQITTSKHFYDTTAHAFVLENAQDMGLKFIKGLSADMDDLPTEKGQVDARQFFQFVEHCIDNDIWEPFPQPAPAPAHVPVGRVPGEDPKWVHKEKSVSEICEGKKPGMVALVADLDPADVQLKAMVDRFAAKIPYAVRLVNIHDFAFSGGCISCFNCAVDGTCLYKDGFSDLLRTQVQTCDAIVLAFTIRDHSMGSRFKTYDDRQFCNGHRTVTMGKPFGYLVSGDYSREKNLQLIVDGRAQVGGNFLAGVASDEGDPDREIDLLCGRLTYAIEHRYVQPSDFLGVGGMKIFRDLIWLMQGMMRADHKFYKAHGQYDFPQKHRGKMLAMYLVGALMSNKKLKAAAGSKMNEGMVAPYKKVLK